MGIRDTWNRIFTKQAEVVLSTILPSWLNEKAEWSGDNIEARVREGYARNELIFSCIELKANSMASAYLRTMNASGDKPAPDAHPLARLIKQPNPFMTEFDFHSLNVCYLDLAGRAYWQKVRNRAGTVIQLWPLRPDRTKPVRSSQKFISGYEYTPPGETKPIPIDAADVMEIKRWHPLDLWGAVSTVGVASRSGDVDNAMTEFLRLFFQNGAMPPGVLSTKQRLSDPQVADARRRWRDRYGGMHNWFEPAVLDSEITYQALTSPLKDMGLDVIDSRSEARLCMALGVPPILVGAQVGLERSTFNNTHEAEAYLWNHTNIPNCKRQRDELQSDLADTEFPGVTLAWDFADVPAMQEDHDAKVARAGDAYGTGNVTDNEYRGMIGLAPLADPDADTTPNQRRAAAPAFSGDGSAQSGAPTGTMADRHTHEGKASDAPDAALRRKRERELQKDMESYFTGFIKRVKQEVQG